MSTITTEDGTQIYYEDWGQGPPVVFSHGWPLKGDSWEDQMVFLAGRGHGVIAHDRRGHGRCEVNTSANFQHVRSCDQPTSCVPTAS